MPKINQAGLAPIMIVGLVALALITAAGTYFALNYATPPAKEPAVTAPNPTPSVTETISIEEVKAANEESLLNMEGVEKVEVGEKDGEPCVIVFTFEETDELQNLENNGLSGYKVVVEDASQSN